MTPGCPVWAQEGPKLGQRGPQEGPRGPQEAQDGPKRAQDGPKTAPRSPKMGPSTAKIAQDGPKYGQDGPNCGSRWPLEGKTSEQHGMYIPIFPFFEDVPSEIAILSPPKPLKINLSKHGTGSASTLESVKACKSDSKMAEDSYNTLKTASPREDISFLKDIP